MKLSKLVLKGQNMRSSDKILTLLALTLHDLRAKPQIIATNTELGDKYLLYQSVTCDTD